MIFIRFLGYQSNFHRFFLVCRRVSDPYVPAFSVSQTISPAVQKTSTLSQGCNTHWYYQACVKISSHNIPDALGFLESKWKEIYPEYPFEYHFLDETIQNQYRAEQAIGKIVTVFTLFALFISCLGILGLSSYTAEQRTKEIGIRKVLGATVSSIVKHISREFVVLVVIANVIIWPLAYFIMNQWLQKFAYRISIGWWSFVLTGVGVLVVSLLTVSWQILQAATANPVDSLRYE